MHFRYSCAPFNCNYTQHYVIFGQDFTRLRHEGTQFLARPDQTLDQTFRTSRFLGRCEHHHRPKIHPRTPATVLCPITLISESSHIITVSGMALIQHGVQRRDGEF